MLTCIVFSCLLFSLYVLHWIVSADTARLIAGNDDQAAFYCLSNPTRSIRHVECASSLRARNFFSGQSYIIFVLKSRIILDFFITQRSFRRTFYRHSSQVESGITTFTSPIEYPIQIKSLLSTKTVRLISFLYHDGASVWMWNLVTVSWGRKNIETNQYTCICGTEVCVQLTKAFKRLRDVRGTSCRSPSWNPQASPTKSIKYAEIKIQKLHLYRKHLLNGAPRRLEEIATLDYRNRRLDSPVKTRRTKERVTRYVAWHHFHPAAIEEVAFDATKNVYSNADLIDASFVKEVIQGDGFSNGYEVVI